MKKIAIAFLLFFITIFSKANIRLPNVISTNMVLQQQSTVKLWGWSNPAKKLW